MSVEPTTPDSTDGDLRAVVEDLASRVSELEDENQQLRERVSELEDREDENQRTRASVSKLINTVRGYDEVEGITPESPSMVAEASNTATELHDTMERARQNAGLLDFKSKRPENASVVEKYLRVLGRAEEKASELETDVVYLNYKEVASHYGCAYKNDGYRIMEEMADRVPGVHYADGRLANPDVDSTTKVEEKSIRVEWQHPDLRGWVRAHRTNNDGGGAG